MHGKVDNLQSSENICVFHPLSPHPFFFSFDSPVTGGGSRFWGNPTLFGHNPNIATPGHVQSPSISEQLLGISSAVITKNKGNYIKKSEPIWLLGSSKKSGILGGSRACLVTIKTYVCMYLVAILVLKKFLQFWLNISSPQQCCNYKKIKEIT